MSFSEREAIALVKAGKVFETRGMSPEAVETMASIKAKAAALYAVLDGVSIPPGNSEAGRLVSLAKTELESSVMWAVKSLSRGGY